MKVSKKAQYRYFNDFIRPAKAFGFDDEKRLQERFGDRSLRLCWNIKNRQCEIWYVEDYKPPYCILTIENHYNLPKAMHELKQRERSQKDILSEYLAGQAAEEQATLDQIKAYTRPMAESIHAKKVGRVSIAV